MEEEFVSFEELYIAYKDCLKNKSNTRSAIRFKMDLAKNLYQLYKDLNNGTYKIGKSIAFIVTRPVKREIFAGNFRDRIVHHLLIKMHNVAFEKEMIYDSYSCRKGKGTLFGIKRFYEQLSQVTDNFTSTKEIFIFRGDLQGFFMHIDKNRLYAKVEEVIKKNYDYSEKKFKWIMDIYHKVIFNRPQDDCIFKTAKRAWIGLPHDKSLFYFDGLPIGNLTSQIFANLFLAVFDLFVLSLEGVIAYGRYVDDFFIICIGKKCLMDIVSLCEIKLHEIGVRLHPKKRYIQHYSKGMDFIGAFIKPHRLYIRSRTIGNLYKRIWEFVEFIRNNEITDEDIKYITICLNSSLGTLKHFASYKIRRKLLTSQAIRPLYQYVKVKDFANLKKLEPRKEYLCAA